MYEDFPYTNLHQLNLDWLVDVVQTLHDNMVISVNGQTGEVVLYKDATVQLPNVDDRAWTILRNTHGVKRGIKFDQDGTAYIVSGNSLASVFTPENPPASSQVTYDQYIRLTTLTGEQLHNWNIFRTLNNQSTGIEFDDTGDAYIISGSNRYKLYSTKNPITSGVSSVNGQTGDVVLYTDSNGEMTMPGVTNPNVDAWSIGRTINGTACRIYIYDDGQITITAGNEEYRLVNSEELSDLENEVSDLKTAFDSTISNTVGDINNSSEYTWTIGRNYSSSGAYDTQAGFAITDLVNVSPETVVINYAPEKGYNNKISTMWIHEFNSSPVWQRRIEIKYGQAYTPNAGTAKIKIAYGYPTAQGVTITQEIVDTYFCVIVLNNTDLRIQKNSTVILNAGVGFQNAGLHTIYSPTVSWANKTINTSTGEVGTTTISDRCCSPDMISVLGFNEIDWNATTPFSPTDALIYYYNLFGDYIGYEYKSKKPVSITNNSVAFIRIQFSSSSSFDASTFDGVLTLTSISNDIIENVNSISEEIPQIGKGAMHKSPNLFDKTTATKNYYVQNSTGTLQPLTDWYASDYIAIKPSTKYTMRYTNQGAFYTAGKDYISGFTGYSTSPEDNPNTVTSPATAEYIRVSVAPLQYNGYMLEEGESYTGFEEYGIYLLEREAVQKWIPSIVQSKNILPVLYHATSENPIRIKLLGDSITAGVGGTGYATNGDYIADTGERMNPDGYCWANLFKAYLESNFHCSVVNYAISGKNSGYYAQRATSMIEETDDIVICMLGTNDRGDQGTTTINTVYPNLETLLNRAKEVGAKFIPMACIPADLPNETTHTSHMEEVDFVINAFSADHNLEYVDVFTSMEWWCEYTGNPLSTYLDSGSLHPNDSGYLVMYKIITRALGIATKIDNADW